MFVNTVIGFIEDNLFILTFSMRRSIWILSPQNMSDHQTMFIGVHVEVCVTSISLSHPFSGHSPSWRFLFLVAMCKKEVGVPLISQPMRDSKKWWSWSLVVVVMLKGSFCKSRRLSIAFNAQIFLHIKNFFSTKPLKYYIHIIEIYMYYLNMPKDYV